MKMLMPCIVMPNDVLKCQFYKSKQMSGLESLCSLLLCEHMVLPPYFLIPAASCSTCLLPSEWLQFLHRASPQWHSHDTQEFVTGSLYVMVLHLPLGGHWWPTVPSLSVSTLQKMTSSDRHPENAFCHLLCFQLSTLLLPLLPHYNLYMNDDFIAYYLLTRKRGLLSLREPML